MLSRSTLKKSNSNTYDPQVANAAQAEAAIAQRSQDFTEKYYNEHISPLLDQQSKLATQANDREQQMFDTNKQLMDQANQRYQTYGIPAENAYYDMVKKYAAPDEQETQAAAAIGDQRTAAQGQQSDMRRTMSSMGIDPSSPAAAAAMSDMAVKNSAIEAAAANRARTAAKTLGMQLTGDAANFGRGGTSQITGFGQAANSNVSTASGALNGAVAGATSGASPVIAGYGLGVNAQGSNLSAYSGLQKQQIEQNGQASQGLGGFLGTVVGAAITKSDRRLKKQIKLLVRNSKGIGLYKFQYKWEPDSTSPHLGYMADEVEKVWPSAVSVDPHGFKQVDYSRVLF